MEARYRAEIDALTKRLEHERQTALNEKRALQGRSMLHCLLLLLFVWFFLRNFLFVFFFF